jgi:hypothetical protein
MTATSGFCVFDTALAERALFGNPLTTPRDPPARPLAY